MSASEPVMDAVEKVARALHEADRNTAYAGSRAWEELRSSYHDHYRSKARHLLAAFPQLALEGREEWGVAGVHGKPFGRRDLEHAIHDAREWNALALTGTHAHAVTRTVWTQPWSKVQS